MKVENFKKDYKKLIFILLFIILGFIALQIPINELAGSKVRFTMFDLFAPVSGAFLGSPIGIISVFLMQGGNLLFHGFSNIDKASIIRLFPTLFAVWYFSLRKTQGKPKRFFSAQSKIMLAVPIVSIILFNLHPIGRTVWFYSMFWLIPIAMWPLREKSLIARSLGATFTAHSVGGAIWIWAFSMPAVIWASLVPITAMERGIFALGISASYVLMNNVMAYLVSKRILPAGINFEKKYILTNK